MPTPHVVAKVLLADPAANRWVDQLLAVLNPILRNVAGDLSGPVAAPEVRGWYGLPLAPSMATPAVDQVPKWNGSAWVAGTAGTAGAVTAVNATAPITSTGGTTPTIAITGTPAGATAYANGTTLAWGSVGVSGQVWTSDGANPPTWQTPTSGFTGASIGSYRATTTTPDTVALTDYIVDVTTTGAFTVNLPTAGTGAGQAKNGRVFIVKNSGGATVTVAPAASQLIDGAASFTIITQYAAFTFTSTGSGWVLT
jgi:hypothetical protein